MDVRLRAVVPDEAVALHGDASPGSMRATRARSVRAVPGDEVTVFELVRWIDEHGIPMDAAIHLEVLGADGKVTRLRARGLGLASHRSGHPELVIDAVPT